MREPKRTRGLVFVAMSGGVDSSVSAYLLKKKYDVVGVHLTCWNEGGCSDAEEADARRVAKTLGIPFHVFDLRKEYGDRVVDYMVRGYKEGITPNPDIMCNKEIKFGAFLEKALAMGADHIATGHYARLKRRGGVCSIYAGRDKSKDQSYFLWTLNQEQLRRVIFPVGGLTKPKVRRIALRAGLHVANKKDSQGVCFVGKVTLQGFLGRYLDKKPGQILDTTGRVIGTHPGAHFFTIGQRHGLGVALSEPHYVAYKDMAENTVVLAKEADNHLWHKTVILDGLNLNPDCRFPLRVRARVRYRQPLRDASASINGDKLELTFKKPVKFVAPGQSAVFYNTRGKLLGGGIIASAKSS